MTAARIHRCAGLESLTVGRSRVYGFVAGAARRAHGHCCRRTPPAPAAAKPPDAPPAVPPAAARAVRLVGEITTGGRSAEARRACGGVEYLAARMVGMTSLLSGPPRPARTAPVPPTDVAHRRPLVLLALLGGVAAAAGPLVVCLGVGVAGWFLSDAGAHGAPRDGLRAGAYAWLMGHGSGLTIAGVTISAIPLGRVADRTPRGRLGLRPRTRRRRDRRRRPRLDRACRDGPVHGGVRRGGRRDTPIPVRRLRARVRHPRGRVVPAP